LVLCTLLTYYKVLLGNLLHPTQRIKRDKQEPNTQHISNSNTQTKTQDKGKKQEKENTKKNLTKKKRKKERKRTRVNKRRNH